MTDPASYAAATFDFHRPNPHLLRLLATWVQALPVAGSMVFGGSPDPQDLRDRIANAVAALVQSR